MMLKYLLILLFLLPAATVFAEEATPAPEVVEEVAEIIAEEPAPDFEQQRQDLFEQYKKDKAEVEKIYTRMINAIEPGPMEIRLQMEKEKYIQEFSDKKKEILADYKSKVEELRKAEAEFKGEPLDEYITEEPKIVLPIKVKPRKKEEKVQRGSRSIPAFDGDSVIGTRKARKGGKSKGGLVKTERRRQMLREKRKEDEERSREKSSAGKQSVLKGIKSRSMFEKNR